MTQSAPCTDRPADRKVEHPRPRLYGWDWTEADLAELDREETAAEAPRFIVRPRRR